MTDRETFLLQARITAADMDAYVEAGWIVVREGADPFAEADVARVRLIRDLREECGVNDEGVDVALRLLDQLHGTRAALARIADMVRRLPQPLRGELAAALRGLDMHDPT